MGLARGSVSLSEPLQCCDCLVRNLLIRATSECYMLYLPTRPSRYLNAPSMIDSTPYPVRTQDVFSPPPLPTCSCHRWEPWRELPSQPETSYLHPWCTHRAIPFPLLVDLRRPSVFSCPHDLERSSHIEAALIRYAPYPVIKCQYPCPTSHQLPMPLPRVPLTFQ
jgi:hypothetical protein